MGWRAQHGPDQSFCEHTIPHDKGRMHGGRTQSPSNTCVCHLSPPRQVARAALSLSFGFSPASQVFLFAWRSRISVPIAVQIVCLHSIGRTVFWTKRQTTVGPTMFSQNFADTVSKPTFPKWQCLLTPMSPESDRRTSVLRPARRLRPHRLRRQGGSDREAALFWIGDGAFQRGGQTHPAAFVQFGRGSRSCA